MIHTTHDNTNTHMYIHSYFQVSDLRQALGSLPQQAALLLPSPPGPLLHKETRVGQC